MATKLFDMNDFAISGIPKMYRVGKFSIKIALQIPGAPQGKYLWCDLSGKNGKYPFNEQQFLAAKHVSLVSFKMDSWKQQGSTRYSTKANGHAALLDVNLEINMGKLGGTVALVNEAMNMIIINVPYMGRDGSGDDAKPVTKYREAMIKWPDDQPLPALQSEVCLLGSLRFSNEGGMYVEARKATII